MIPALYITSYIVIYRSENGNANKVIVISRLESLFVKNFLVWFGDTSGGNSMTIGTVTPEAGYANEPSKRNKFRII